MDFDEQLWKTLLFWELFVISPTSQCGEPFPPQRMFFLYCIICNQGEKTCQWPDTNSICKQSPMLHFCFCSYYVSVSTITGRPLRWCAILHLRHPGNWTNPVIFSLYLSLPKVQFVWNTDTYLVLSMMLLRLCNGLTLLPLHTQSSTKNMCTVLHFWIICLTRVLATLSQLQSVFFLFVDMASWNWLAVATWYDLKRFSQLAVVLLLYMLAPLHGYVNMPINETTRRRKTLCSSSVAGELANNSVRKIMSLC